MSIILVFMTVIGAVVVWWLSRQRLMSKPWLETGVPAAPPGTPIPTAKIGLGVLLAVLGGLFALFGSAFVMRMEYADWSSVPLPRVIWLNTAILILSSLFLHFAAQAARRGELPLLRANLAAGGVSALAFVAGQLLAWRVLLAEGESLTSGPGASFFYLITGLHGLHILGGVAALARTARLAGSGGDPRRLRLGVELCATYWHFLLLVWIALLALMLGWANALVDICRGALT